MIVYNIIVYFISSGIGPFHVKLSSLRNSFLLPNVKSMRDLNTRHIHIGWSHDSLCIRHNFFCWFCLGGLVLPAVQNSLGFTLTSEVLFAGNFFFDRCS